MIVHSLATADQQPADHCQGHAISAAQNHDNALPYREKLMVHELVGDIVSPKWFSSVFNSDYWLPRIEPLLAQLVITRVHKFFCPETLSLELLDGPLFGLIFAGRVSIRPARTAA